MAFKLMTTRANGYVVTATDWTALTDNMTALNTAFMMVPLFPHSSGIAPTSGLQAAALSTVQSSGAGTVKAEWPILSFDASTDEGRIWNGMIARCFGVTVTAQGQFYAASATSGNFVVAGQLACWSDGDASATAKVLATENSATVAVPGSAGTIKAFSITMTNDDSMAAIDSYSFVFRRDADNASDTATGDMQLKSLALYFSLTSTTV